MRIFARPAAALLVATAAGLARGGSPPDDLLAMIPPDAGAVLIVEDLRDRAREILASPLVASFRALPTVQGWERSENVRTILAGRAEVEKALGVDLSTLRDELVGDCVVLAIHLPAGRRADEAKGLLLSRVRDRKALDRLIAGANAAESASGELAGVEQTPGEPGSPQVFRRRFAPNTKPDEWFAIAGETYAWSNSEPLLRNAISRSAPSGPPARLRSMREQMPRRSLVQVYADPRFLERLIEPGEGQDADLPRRILSAVEYLGAAVEWRDGPVLHLRESIDPGRVPAFLRPAAAADPGGPGLFLAPPSAIAAASWSWDPPAIYDGLSALIPEGSRARARAINTVATGLLLGKDYRRDLLPSVGSRGIATLDEPEGGGMIRMSARVELKGVGEVADALENGLRTLAALATLDPGRAGAATGVEAVDRGGVRVTSLVGGDQAWSFAVTPGRLVLAADPETASREAVAGPVADRGTRIARMTDLLAPRCLGFVAIDLERLQRVAGSRADRLARASARRRGRPEAEARRDLDRALELIRPLGGAIAAWSSSPDGRSWSQVVALVGRSGESPQ